jgi:WD40 repeat protein
LSISDPENIQLLTTQLNLLLHGHGTSDTTVRLDNGGHMLSTGLTGPEEAVRYQVLRLGRDTLSVQRRAYLTHERRWVSSGHGSGAAVSASTLPARWATTEAVFPVTPEGSEDAEPPSPAEDARARLKIGDSVLAQDRFIARVAEVARIRYTALGEATVTQIEPTADSPGHLRVTCKDGMIVSQHPVGVVEGDPDPEIIDRFVQRVHRLYAVTDAQLVSDLVFGGNPVSSDLRDYARHQGVRLVSFIEYQGLLDLREYLASQTRQLERDPLYAPTLYMPQRFRSLGWSARGQLPMDVSGLADADAAGGGEDALGQVVQWLVSDQVRLVLLLGDFGRGKTFLLHELARRLPEKMPHVIPMLVELRNLDKAHGIDQLIAAHLIDSGVGTFDQAKFRYMLRHGRIVLLFDGFDELALRITYERATEHLDTLLEAVEGQAKVVLTSRTQHFQSDRQLRTALDHRIEILSASRVAILEDFSDAQIEQFLSRHYGGDQQRATARMELIRDVRDLLGLARNPRMLGFIARLEASRLRQVQARTGSITSADLYQELLRYWLEHEARRARPAGGPPALTATDMWTALTALAIRLWQATDQTISPAELADATGYVLATLEAHGLNEGQFAHQIGSGTLLVRTGDDTFRFVHASVMEYLVAFASARWLRGQGGPDDDLLGLRPISPLMADFVVGLAGHAPVLGWTRRVLADPDASNTVRINALAFARSLDPAAARGARLADARLEGFDLSSLDLTDADLSRANLTAVRAAGTSLHRAKLHGATLVDARIMRSSVTQADLTEADFSRARLIQCDFSGATLENSIWTQAALLGCTIDAPERPPLAAAAIAQRDPAELMTTAGGEVWSIAFSPDGQMLAYAVSNSLLFADLSTWSLLRANADHSGPILSLHYLRDNTGLVTGSGDGTLRLWDAATGACRKVLRGHEGQVRSVVVSTDGQKIVSSGDDGTVRVWDASTGDALHVLPGHQGPARSVVISLDGTVIASGGDDGTVRIWDVGTGQAIHVLQGHGGQVQSVAISPDGATVASGASDGGVAMWDVRRGSQTVLDGHRGPVITVAFSPDGTKLATGDDFAEVRLWDERLYGQLLGDHRGPVIIVAFSPDGRTLASGSYDGTVRLWDTDYGSCRQVLPGHRGPVWSVVFSPDGSTLASGGDFGTLRLWDTAYGTCRQVLDGSRRPVLSTAVSSDGMVLASGNGDGTVRVWDPVAGVSRHVLEGHGGPVSAIDISPDGMLLASASGDGTVRIWDPVAGVSHHVLEGHVGPVSAVKFSSDGKKLASGGDDRTIRLWRLDGDSVELTGHRGQVHAVAFSPDGTLLASCSYDGTVRLWDAVREIPSATLDAGGSPVRSVSFSPDGHTMVSTGDDCQVHVWNAAERALLFVLSGHSDWIWSTAFSPDSSLLATGCDDGTVRLWDVRTGDCVHLLSGHRGWVRTVRFSPDGKVLASGGHDGTIRLHDVASGSLSSIMVGLRDQGWATHRQDGTYSVAGAVGDEFWWAIKLCRFDTGDLDPYVPVIRAAD